MHIDVLTRWKLGQLSPGSTVQFRRISWNDSLHLLTSQKKWLDEMTSLRTHPNFLRLFDLPVSLQASSQSPVLHRHTGSDDGGNSGGLKITFRQVLMLFLFCQKPCFFNDIEMFLQAGDSAILVEFGTMNLDVYVRAQIHAFQQLVLEKQITGVRSLCPCIRSIMVKPK